MAHLLNLFTDGRARMAYVGETPWHGLGQQLTPDASIDVWAREAGMDFEILGSPVMYKNAEGKTFKQESKQVLYRADTNDALGVVGSKYKVVQPRTILEFFRNLVEEQGFKLETAGVLFNGAKYWALASTGEEIKLRGDDKVRQHLMLATACDGSLRTTAKFVSTRVVCNNTIAVALGEDNPAGTVKVSHSSTFDAGEVQADLGLVDEAWQLHAELIKAMSKRKVTEEEAVQFVIELVGDPKRTPADNQSIDAVGKVLGLYAGNGLGAELPSAANTAWGLLNAATEYVDWHIGKNQNRRLEAAWMYQGTRLKTYAFDLASRMVA